MSNKDLKDVGLKVTLPRVKILQLFENHKERHLSAEAIFRLLSESGEEVSLATIYRVLTQFEAAGLVKKHNFENDYAVYELDAGDHHDHLVCVRCSQVVEFVDPIIEDRQKYVAEQAGYQITDHALNIYGICGHCNKS